MFLNPGNVLAAYPDAWVIDLAEPFDRGLKYISKDLSIGALSVSDITRSISELIGAPIEFFNGLLVEGFYFSIGEDYYELPPLSWVTTAALLVLLPMWVGGLRIGLLAAFTVFYALVFGLWESTILTLVSVLFSVAFATFIGLVLGILASRSDTVSAILRPVYDALQTIPVFSYLSIILVFFGFGPVAALIATVIFALAPMARTTELALRQTPQAIQELAEITGCSPRQRLFLVTLPAARTSLMIGINQVTMLSLAMVIIASIIGAGGLGSDVLRGLKSMRLTEALLAGLAISLVAITIDRTLRTWTEHRRDVHDDKPSDRRIVWLIAGVLLLISVVAYFSEALLFAPTKPLIENSRVLDDMLTNLNLFVRDDLAVVQDGFISWIMVPYRNFIASLPWLPFALLVGVAATALKGVRLGLMCFLLVASLAIFGLWARAMLSFYLVTLALFVGLVIGLPLGVMAGLNRRAYMIVEICSDVIQTLPTFVYLIPVVVLFGAGDFPALIAIIIYLFAPIIRYTANGIQQVSSSTLCEAADMTGCTMLQRLRLVLLPVAMPQIVLGINQAVMLGFGMLVITSLVGSRGLEESTLVAVAQVKPGQGIMAGFGIAVLAIVLDRLLRGASDKLSNSFQPSRT
ncbi:ABC transporter permease subunit [Pseudohalocynthiibacter aestuariivivens]|nr:ABC transporter permease subunit [Pseudohalocynthiibacter aestuariivivens]QIE45199.1 ABC transporter permease subunit [Pseudohalocynthiibacter aestuariivivens]